MTEQTATAPGPWRVEECGSFCTVERPCRTGGSGLVVVGSDGEEVAALAACGSHSVRATGRLLAAAPALLAACHRAAALHCGGDCEWREVGGCPTCEAAELAAMAIWAATGRKVRS